MAKIEELDCIDDQSQMIILKRLRRTVGKVCKVEIS